MWTRSCLHHRNGSVEEGWGSSLKPESLSAHRMNTVIGLFAFALTAVTRPTQVSGSSLGFELAAQLRGQSLETHSLF